MKCICILILACLLLTACQQQSSTITPDNNATIATIVAGVMQTLTAQAAVPTPDIQTAIVQTSTATPDNNATIVAGVMQTLTAQAAVPTPDIQTAIVQTLTAMPTGSTSQPTQPPDSATPSAEHTPTLASSPTPSNSTPQIIFTSVPPMGSSEDLYGRVEGVNPEMYGVAVYIRVGGGWWTKPTFAAPVTPIALDGTWNCPYATGGNDTSATVISAYLIPIGYNPPAMSGGSSLPSVLEKNAVAKVEATR